jgi:hypothetical protein
MTAEEYVASCKDSLLDNLFLSQKTEDLGKEANENLHTFHITKELAKNITLFQVKSIIEHAVSKFTDIVTKNNDQMRAILYVWHDFQAGALRFSIVTDRPGVKLPFSAEILPAPLEEIISDWLKSDYLEGIPWVEFTKAQVDKLIDEMPVEERKYPKLSVHATQLTPRIVQ